jgi:hypothetical protein
MANYGPSNIAISFDDSTGTPVVMTAYILTINGFDKEAAMEETTAFGSAWKTSKATGVRMVGDIVLGGLYDDTADTGPDAIFNDVVDGPSDSTRTFALTYGGSKSSSVETWIKKYRRIPGARALTRYEVTLEPTGAVTEA